MESLLDAFKSLHPQIFLKLSSSAGILGREYRRAHEVLDPAKLMPFIFSDMTFTKFVHLELSGTQSQEPMPQGLIPLTKIQLHALLDISLNSESSDDRYQHILAGFDRQSVSVSKNRRALDNPLLSHLPKTITEQEERDIMLPPKISQGNVDETKGRDDAYRNVTSSLQSKISDLVETKQDMIDLSTPIEDFGLDSLMILELTNWICETFRTSFEQTEASDATSILSLASTILDRGASFRTAIGHQIHHRDVDRPQASQDPQNFPRQPLPRLEDSLQNYLDTVRPFCSDEEFERTSQAVIEFKEPSKIGVQLQDRLVEREGDPDAENWLGDLYTPQRYRRLRSPLMACSSYFLSHPFGQKPHGQAERAALISSAVWEFKRKLEAMELGNQVQSLSGQAMDPSVQQYLFNSCREPHLGEDQIRKYPNSDHIVVLRYGHAFKIPLSGLSSNTSFKVMFDMYERIVKTTPKDICWTSFMTACDRDLWARVGFSNLVFNNES